MKQHPIRHPLHSAAARDLNTLPGGLLLADHKQLSTCRPLAASALPQRLIIPMQQHIGQPCEALVQVGERVLKGQKIADAPGNLSAPVHASSSGRVVEIATYPIPHPSALTAPCIVIASDGEEQWCRLEPLRDDPTTLEREPLVARIRAAGVVGMGGGGFPSSIKLTPGSERNIHTLVINGVECEPYITCDDLLMRSEAARVVRGIGVMLHLLRAERCLIGIEDNKPEAAAAMQAAVAEQGLPHTEVVVIPTRYPSGGEKQLIYILTGLEVPSGKIPADIGCVCHNVGTAAAVGDAIFEGRPQIERIVTLSGAGVVAPQNLRVRIGTLIADLIPQVGGYTPLANRMILGGPMMGFTLAHDQIPITKAANSILVPSAAELPDPGPALPCIRCGRCAEVCPMWLLPQQMYWHIRAKNPEKSQAYNLLDCIECGCCAHVCPSHIPLVQYFRFAKADLRERAAEARRNERAQQRSMAREERLQRLEAEKQARLAAKKAAAQERIAANQQVNQSDPKQAAIAAARQRAAEKRARLAAQGVTPQNTEALKDFQQRQIAAAERRRQASSGSPPAPAEKP